MSHHQSILEDTNCSYRPWKSPASDNGSSFFFYKLIVASSNQDKKLRIPIKFVKSFRDELSSVVTLSLPNGRVWYVGLKKKVGDKIWFDNGWHEFFEHYSIRDGYFLVFKYQGGSNFDIHIYDLPASEINYESNTIKELNHGKRCPAVGQDEPNQCATSSSMKNKVFDQCVDRQIPNNSYNSPSLHYLIKTYHESILGLEEQDRNAASLDGTKKDDQQLSKNVQSSPASFVRDVSFKVTGERIRLAQNVVNSQSGFIISRGNEIHFSESKLTESTDEVGLHLQDKAKQGIETSKRQIQRTESNKHESSAKHKKEKETTNDIKTNYRFSNRTRPVTTQEKQRASCAATLFKPSNPFCKVILQPSHVYRVFLVHMPSSFAKKYLSEGSRSIKLETCDGKRWPVRCIKSANDAFKLSKGWIEFVKDNNLEEGDVCVFELIQVNDIVLKVTIFRVLEDVDEDDDSLEIFGSSHPCPRQISLGKSEMPNSRRSSPSNCEEVNQCSTPRSLKNKTFGQCVDQTTPSDSCNRTSLHNLVRTFHESIVGVDKQDRNAAASDGTETDGLHPSKNVQNSQALVPITRDISFKATEEQLRLAQNGIQFSESKHTESRDNVGLHLQDEAKQIIATSKRQTQRTEPNKYEASAKHKKEKETANDNIKTTSRDSTRTRPVTTQEKHSARFAATCFNPSNPFCKVIMKPSYVYRGFFLHMPSSFGKQYLNEVSGSIKLETCDGKQWPVRCIKTVNAIKLSKGWAEFVYDNNLEEDDVCIFELIQVNETVLKVTIFRESKLTKSRDNVGLHLQDEAKQIIETSKRQIQRTGPNKHEPSAKRKKEKETTNDNIKTTSRVSTRTRPVTTQEKHGARCAATRFNPSTRCAATRFNPSNPFCKVIMKPSYVYRGFFLHMPSSFGNQYLNEVSGSIKLETCDGKQWPVRCIKTVNAIKLSKGWTEFVYDNNLEEDDVCVFELIQVNEIVLKVTIFRVLEDNTAPPTEPQPQILIDS